MSFLGHVLDIHACLPVRLLGGAYVKNKQSNRGYAPSFILSTNMKTNKLRLLFTAILALVASMMSASEKREIDGVYYYLFNTTDGNSECEATIIENPNKYSGDIIIPESVTYEGISYKVTGYNTDAFRNCSEMTSLQLPATCFGWYFSSDLVYGCTALSSLTINGKSDYCSSIDGVIFTADEKTLVFCPEGKEGEYSIPQGVISISSYAFEGCTKISSINIPESTMSIGDGAFAGCSGLTNVTIPEGVTSVGNYAFRYCSSLVNISIPSGTVVAGNAFKGCTAFPETDGIKYAGNVLVEVIDKERESYEIKAGTKTICDSAFDGCKQLCNIDIPASVEIIGAYAFTNCTKLETINVLGDNLAEVGDYFAPSKCKIFVQNEGTLSCLALWCPKESYSYSSFLNQTVYYYYAIYNKTTGLVITRPSVVLGAATQSTITPAVKNPIETYEYAFATSEVASDGSIRVIYENLTPETSYAAYLYAKLGNSKWYCIHSGESLNTANLGLDIKTISTASSIEYEISYIEGDAKISNFRIYIDNKKSEEEGCKITGLNPKSSTKIEVDLKANGKLFTKTIYANTLPIEFENSPAKVVSVGNVIISSKTNVDNDEENIGFEWRRQDWSEINPSNTGTAYIYEGTMEGYIRNLYADAQWKYRPYYLASDGTYYYGDWMGFDPTNTSFFEATVHTYEKINIEGNTALVKGYALRGTDAIKVQGFRYWKSASANVKAMAGAATPSDYMTVEAKGQVMEVELTGLDYETTYCYQAFAETEEDTVLGEIRTFTTGENPNAILDVVSKEESAPVVEIGRYDINGRMIKTSQKGINIIRMSDGSVKKVFVK